MPDSGWLPSTGIFQSARAQAQFRSAQAQPRPHPPACPDMTFEAMPLSPGKKPLGNIQPQPPPSSQNAAKGQTPNTPSAEAEGRTVSTPADEPTLTLVPAHSALNGTTSRYSQPLYVLMLAVGIILLIA